MRKDWIACTFEDLTISLKRGPFGGDLKKDFFVSKGYAVYEQQHAIGNDFSNIRYFINDERYKLLQACNVGPGDYIVSCSGTIGRIARIPKSSPEGVINQALLRIRINDRIISHNYFLEFFRSSIFQKKILKDSRGSGMQNIAGIKEIKLIDLKIPPLPEQRAIVLKIEELFSEIDNGIANLNEAKEKLKIYRQAVLKKAFEGELTNKNVKVGKLPEGWLVEELRNITIKVKKVKVNEKEPNDEFIYLDIGSIDNSILKIVSHKHYQWKNAPSRAQQIIELGDTLFSTVRIYLKNIALVEKEIYHNQICSSGFMVIRANREKIEPKYLFFYSTYKGFIDPLIKLQTGTSYPAVRYENVISQPINYPISQEEQKQIVQEIETRLSVCDNALSNIEEALEKSNALKQSILKKAFDGELLSQQELEKCRLEADWEPAEKLLEKIKQEKKK